MRNVLNVSTVRLMPLVHSQRRSTSPLINHESNTNLHRKLQDTTERLATGFEWSTFIDAMADVYLGVRQPNRLPMTVLTGLSSRSGPF